MIRIGQADDIWNILPDLPVPEPWNSDHGIPWFDKDFSRRILQEHLSPDHDRASRRPSVIDTHTDWIHTRLLKERKSRILDLGCGPGLYTSSLARKGHSCTGIDFSPAAIDFARSVALRSNNTDVYHLSDIRRLPDYMFDTIPYDLILFIYGEFCTFKPVDALQILEKCSRSLAPDGHMILEILTARAVYEMGVQPSCRNKYSNGVFGDMPYQCFEEYFWNTDAQTATVRYCIVSNNDSSTSHYYQTYQAWHNDALSRLFDNTGFSVQKIYPYLGGIPDENNDDFRTFLLKVQSDL